ncbi:hypothetical protein DU506_00910 [Vreelandella rituensis]|uniref:Uncharacterized protein n=2 Tax=Vreelandella rituensis TaxID=2282306 RepID=A0A368U9V1_9GAMM|nr:hypothetical protein DU506_00910 [Halomonas rituensis]
MIATEDVMGITYSEEGVALLDNGQEMGKCTHCAWWIIEALGEGDVYGFCTRDNPVGNPDIQDWVGGHDFALIRGRYIVDPWLGVYSAMVPAGTVFDLQEPADRAAIRHHYGDPARWSWFSPDSRECCSPASHEYPSDKHLVLPDAKPIETLNPTPRVSSGALRSKTYGG